MRTTWRPSKRRSTRPSRTTDKPTLIIVKSIIGYGAPNKQDTHEAHGEPLGEEEIKLTKKFYGWPRQEVLRARRSVQHFADGIGARGKKLHADWKQQFDEYEKAVPELADEAWQMHRIASCRRVGTRTFPTFPADAKGMASRDSSGKVLNAIAQNVPWLIGGSADLAPSTKTLLTFEGAGDFEPDNYGGRNLHFGIREHGMGAVCNGMALSGLRPFGVDVLRLQRLLPPSIRLAAIMEDADRSTCSRTIRSASAKTARRISRSSIWRRCAAFRA